MSGGGLFTDREIYFITCFFIGINFYLYKKHIILNKYIFILALIAFWGCLNIQGLTTPLHNLLLFISLPYIVFFVAYNFPVANNFSKYGDFSYGLYIYAFPIQQAISALTNAKINIGLYFVITYLLTLMCAFMSWNLVEKKVLALKKVSFKDFIRKKIDNIYKKQQ